MAKKYELIHGEYDTRGCLLCYGVKDELGNCFDASLSGVYKLADRGMITNAKLGGSKSKPRLVGVGTDLRKLRRIVTIKSLFVVPEI